MCEHADRVSLYDYHLPEGLIARRPLAERERARLLVVNRLTGRFTHSTMAELPGLLAGGDCLVLNDTQVVPARLFGRRSRTGGKWEGLFLEVVEPGVWRIIGQTRGRLEPGETIEVFPAHAPGAAESLRLELVHRESDGQWVVRANSNEDAFALLAKFGTVPLPPYIERPIADEADWQAYQTTFARRPGAVAAPTAGLHFTPALLERCRSRGIGIAFVTPHVGLGTFRPIAVERLSAHQMHAEWCELPPATASVLQETRSRGGRIIAVGTTAVRTLESAALHTGGLAAWTGQTDLFIRPPWQFRAVDGLVTNFHLPRSTLLVLVSALAGRERVLRAYAEAIAERYRFYSYGDAMLIV
ncbi:MAG: tRNA preQ1(34) S-adenosylmethionine ribosyltransferase-isomerase QueA [Planctomycetes bacterium]|nr:tRNA preQ1(34) S-adenosylmethionine ribosyltransferase-isomerase QueA [Planctomycetota bacterium]